MVTERWLLMFRLRSTTSDSRNIVEVLIYNYIPCSPANVKKHKGKLSRAERLNGFTYHENWLQNLVTATSMKGFRC